MGFKQKVNEFKKTFFCGKQVSEVCWIYDSFNSCLMPMSDNCSQDSCKQVLSCGVCLQR